MNSCGGYSSRILEGRARARWAVRLSTDRMQLLLWSGGAAGEADMHAAIGSNHSRSAYTSGLTTRWRHDDVARQPARQSMIPLSKEHS
jgi:hypothetical protein